VQAIPPHCRAKPFNKQVEASPANARGSDRSSVAAVPCVGLLRQLFPRHAQDALARLVATGNRCRINGRLISPTNGLLPPPSHCQAGRRSSSFPYDDAILCHCNTRRTLGKSVGTRTVIPNVPDSFAGILLVDATPIRRHRLRLARRSAPSFAEPGPTLPNDPEPFSDWASGIPTGGCTVAREFKSQIRRPAWAASPIPKIEIRIRAHAQNRTPLTHLGLKLPGNQPNAGDRLARSTPRLSGFEVEITTGLGPTVTRP